MYFLGIVQSVKMIQLKIIDLKLKFEKLMFSFSLGNLNFLTHAKGFLQIIAC